MISRGDLKVTFEVILLLIIYAILMTVGNNIATHKKRAKSKGKQQTETGANSD